MIKKTIILILLSTLFISCNEGARYDEPDVPTNTNNNNPIGTTCSKVDSVEKTILRKKTYEVSKCNIIDISIADILATPDFVRVLEITVYEQKKYRSAESYYNSIEIPQYHKIYSDDYDLNANIPDSQKSSYTIPEDSILRVTLDKVIYMKPQDFIVIVGYQVKVKVPKSRVIGAY